MIAVRRSAGLSEATSRPPTGTRLPIRWLLPALLAIGCATPTAPTLDGSVRAAHGWPAQVDWGAEGERAAAMLSEYLRIRTVNPPGDELLGARFLGRRLAAAAIDSASNLFAPGRSVLLARLEGDGSGGRPLCLLNPIDVAPADPSAWTRPDDAFSGRRDADGMIWGRGALEMKGLAIVQLRTMALLEALRVPLTRDVVFVAVGDQEVDHLGIRHLADRWADKVGCSHVITGGAIGSGDAKEPDRTLYAVSTSPGNASPLDDPVYRALVRHTLALHDAEARPGRPVASTVLSPAPTAARFLRPLGVKAYGFAPFIITEAEAATVRGPDERISTDNLRAGVRALFSAVVEIAGRPARP